MKIDFNESELEIYNTIIRLKSESGTHSPSLTTIKENIPNLKISIDACFLSNPYATDLFINYFKKELLDEKFELRNLLEYYPSQNRVIAQNLSNFLNISINKIFIGNGAIEIIQAVIQRFTRNKIIINLPTFSSYYEFVNPSVKVLFNFLKKEDNFQLDIEQYIELCKKEKPDTIVLINPNNPDGGYINKSSIIRILEELTFINNIIIDESFLHFAYENDNLDLISNYDLINSYSNLIIIKSMSKDFGIAGIRAGYAIMDDKKVHELLSNGYLWNTNGLAEYFFNLYTRDNFQKEYELIRKKYINETNILNLELNKFSQLKIYPSYANFFLIEILESYTADEFAFGLLAKHSIYTRTCSDKKGLEQSNFVRLASRSNAENSIILNSIRKMIN